MSDTPMMNGTETTNAPPVEVVTPESRTIPQAQPPQLPTKREAEVSVAIAPDADLFMDPAAFKQAWRAAQLFASSRLVPEHLRGKVEDCMIAFAMARELGESPIVVMQNIYFVSGKAGWNATYMIARANKSKKFRGTITWETKGAGEELAMVARACLAETGEVVEAEASLKMAHAEGWTKNSKYKSMPSQMLRYRSATMLIRLYAPEVMLGYHTIDELEDVRAAEVGSAEQVPGSEGIAAALGVGAK